MKQHTSKKSHYCAELIHSLLRHSALSSRRHRAENLKPRVMLMYMYVAVTGPGGCLSCIGSICTCRCSLMVRLP